MSNDPPKVGGDAMSGEDFADYLPIYLDETEEQLDDLVETMLALEQNPGDRASLQTAFRLLHSMKGASGMMGLDQITALTHHLETRFERLRSGTLQLDRTTMNLTLRCIDFLKNCNDQVRNGEPISTPADLLGELQRLEDSSERRVEDEPIDPGVSQIIAEVTGIPLGDQSAARDKHAGEEINHDQAEATIATPVGDEVVESRQTELADEVVHHIILRLASEAIESEAIESVTLKDATEFASSLGEVLASRPELDEFEEQFDGTIEMILQTNLDPRSLCDELAANINRLQSIEIRIPRDSDSPPLATWEAVVSPPIGDKQINESPEQPPQVPTGETGPVDDQFLRPLQQDAMPASVPAKTSETMRVDIGRLDHLMNLAGELVVNRAQFAQLAGDLSAGSFQARMGLGSDRKTQTGEFCESFSHAIERLKAGEAIDAESTRELEEGLEWIRQQSELWESNRASFSKLDEAIDQLARISDSLQRGVLGTRMVPIGPLLNRFRRIVRDLSLQFSKEVTLTLEGESTELDKRMIDALSDPITHLIRNSLDHGLESPQERAEAGKPERGTIVLAARHSGNQVSIIVRDDGRGISADRIRDSLVNKKLMSRAQADAMSEDDAIASIFHPGFSTASQITNVSGRGVGMDIVKATITELNGTIDIDTCVGRGTTFTIQLPLTLAIIGSLLFRMGRVTFAVPKDDVREIVSIHPDQIVEVHGKRTFQVRGVYLPLIRITDVLRFHDETVCARDDSQSQPRPTEIAILHAADQVIGLQVDQCVGSQDVVIKSLAENLTYLPGLAGASILGDGTVALMLDVASLPRLLARTTDPQQAIA